MIIDFTSCRRILHKAYNGANLTAARLTPGGFGAFCTRLTTVRTAKRSPSFTRALSIC